MNIIRENPYRILGVTANATEKELKKQISILKRYAEIGKTKSFDYDFEFIGNFSRSAEDIQEASNKIEQSHNKLLYSLFWFVNKTPFDDIALNNLKENNIEKAIEIWDKTLKEEITQKNYSSYLNLSTLYIALSVIEEQIDLQKLHEGISLKGVLINSETLRDLSSLVTGDGVTNSQTKIGEKFVDEVIEQLKPYLDKSSGITIKDLISIFNTFPSGIQKYVLSKFTEGPISNIENKIEKCVRKRINAPENADKYGEELYKSTQSDIVMLKKLVGKSNLKFQMLADKIANEILQCSIDFFNIHIEDNNGSDTIDEAYRIAQYANSIETNKQTKNQITNAIEELNQLRDKLNKEIVKFLEGIINIYKKVEEENKQSYWNNRTFYVDENKIIEDSEYFLADKNIIRIAKSNNDNFINDFYYSIKEVIKKVSKPNKIFFERKKELFVRYLPITNKLKYNLEKSKLEDELNTLFYKLSKIRLKQYYMVELLALNAKLKGYQFWSFLSGKMNDNQIAVVKQKIQDLNIKAEKDKKRDILAVEKQISVKKEEIAELNKIYNKQK
jgi:hypothetical protein